VLYVKQYYFFSFKKVNCQPYSAQKMTFTRFKLPVCVLFLCFCWLFIGCQAHKGSLKAKRISDENAADAVFYNFDPEYKVYYAIQHNQTDLLVRLKIKDEQSMAKILAFGLTVWVDSTGKGKKTLGIEYPLAASERNRTAFNTPEGEDQSVKNAHMDRKQRIAAIKQKLTDGLQEADLHHFSADGPDRIVLPDRRGINLKLDFDSAGVLLYSMKFPLALLKTGIAKLTKDSTKAISIGLVSGKPEFKRRTDDANTGGMGSNSMGNNGMGGMGGYGSGMGNGMGSMAGGRGFGGPRGAGAGPSFNPVTIWLKVKFQK
jgi:hypothetical protein